MSSSSETSSRQPPHVAKFEKGARVTAQFVTSMGTFVCSLFADRCPITVGNFVGLARGETPWTADHSPAQSKPAYDGTIFHRVIPDFMIQGGDPLGTGMGGPGYRFDDELVAELKHDKPGVLSMANSGRNTNGSQFFVTDAATPWLDGRHAVFGEVTSGMEVVQQIARVAADQNNRPNKAVVLQKVIVEVS